MTNYEIKIGKELQQSKEHYQQHMKTISVANKDQIQKWIEKQQYNKEIENFNHVIKNKNNIIFYTNLKNLKFKTYHLVSFKRNSTGSYHIKKNKITLNQNRNNATIYHELFHASSSIYLKKQKMMFSGFYHANRIDKIGFGLGMNEGYTQYLTKKYFHNSNIQGYFYEQKIMKYLEKIIGEQEMEEMYFTANLYQLVEVLQKYNTIDKIISFISHLDDITLIRTKVK